MAGCAGSREVGRWTSVLTDCKAICAPEVNEFCWRHPSEPPVSQFLCLLLRYTVLLTRRLELSDLHIPSYLYLCTYLGR